MTFGQRLREERARRGIRQRDVARLAGVTAITVSRWERGAESPRLEHARRLAEGLGWTLAHLAGEVAEMPAALPSTVPVYDYGTEGEGVMLDDAGHPVAGGIFEIIRSIDNADPYAYAIRVQGTLFAPYFFPGDVLELAADVPVRGPEGEAALLLYRDGRRRLALVRRVERRGIVIAEPVTRVTPPEEIAERELRAIHKVVSIRRRGMYPEPRSPRRLGARGGE